MIVSLPVLEKNYKIEMKIGSGGMGEVYLATDKRLDRPVAIKILKLQETNYDAFHLFVDKFQVEAKAIARLMHPNIVSIYDFGNEGSQYYMIMEYLEGKNLAKVIQSTNQKFPASMISSIAFQVCNALEYAHENKIVHRDIKPENIILSKKGIVKLTDFGIAKMNYDKIIEDSSKNSDSEEVILGSVIYSSPEQLKDASSIDHRADIYSLGITLYELVSGRTPFGSSSVSDAITKIFTETPKSLKPLFPDLPELLDNIILKAISKDPMTRFQSAREMKEALIPLLGKEVIQDKSYSNLENLVDLTSENIKSNPIAESKARTTLLLKNTLFNKEKESLKLTNIVSETNPSLTMTLTKMSEVIKNFSWISSIIFNWSSLSINTNNTKQVMETLTNQNVLGKSFTGVCVINKNIFIFLHDGYVLGALDILNNKVGDSVIANLPENCQSVEVKSNNVENDYSPIILYNLVTSGTRVLSDLESDNTDLLGVIEHLSFDEEFTGYIVCNSKSMKKSKTYNILHVEDDKIAQVVLSQYFEKNKFSYNCISTETVEGAKKTLANNNIDLIVLDYNLYDGTALDVLEFSNNIPVLITTISNDPKVAVNVMKKGALDCFIKDSDSKYLEVLNDAIKENLEKNKGKTENTSDSEISYYYTYQKGKADFSIRVNKNNAIDVNSFPIKDLINEYNVVMDIYQAKFDILSSSSPSILKNSKLSCLYKSNTEKTLASLVSVNSISPENEKSLRNNFYINLELKKNIVSVLYDEVNIEHLVKLSLYYKFMTWFFTDLFFIINSSSNQNSLNYIYDSIPKVEKITCFDSLNGSDNSKRNFSAIMSNSQQVLFLVGFGSSDPTIVDAFVQDCISVKKSNPSIKSCIYVSQDEYSEEVLNNLAKITKGATISFFDKFAKYKGLIRVEKDGIQISLIQFNKRVKSFNTIFPDLF